MKKAELINCVKSADVAIRDSVKCSLARVNLKDLPDLPYPTIKKISNWYGRLLDTEEYKTRQRIWNENPSYYWANLMFDDELAEVRALKAADKAFQKMFKATLPKEITRDKPRKDSVNRKASYY